MALSEYPISSFSGFSSEMSLPKDEWTYSTNLTLMTTPINKGESFNKQWQAYAVKPSQLDKQQTLIDEEQVIINNFKALYKKQRLLLEQGKKIPSYKLMSNEVIERAEERLKQKKEKLFEMQNYKVPVVRFDDIADEAYTVDYPRQMVKMGMLLMQSSEARLVNTMRHSPLWSPHALLICNAA